MYLAAETPILTENGTKRAFGLTEEFNAISPSGELVRTKTVYEGQHKLYPVKHSGKYMPYNMLSSSKSEKALISDFNIEIDLQGFIDGFCFEPGEKLPTRTTEYNREQKTAVLTRVKGNTLTLEPPDDLHLEALAPGGKIEGNTITFPYINKALPDVTDSNYKYLGGWFEGYLSSHFFYPGIFGPWISSQNPEAIDLATQIAAYAGWHVTGRHTFYGEEYADRIPLHRLLVQKRGFQRKRVFSAVADKGYHHVYSLEPAVEIVLFNGIVI